MPAQSSPQSQAGELPAHAHSGLAAELLIFSGRFLVDVFALLTALLTGLLAFCERFLAVFAALFARLLVFYGRLLAATLVAPVAFFVQLLVFCE